MPREDENYVHIGGMLTEPGRLGLWSVRWQGYLEGWAGDQVDHGVSAEGVMTSSGVLVSRASRCEGHFNTVIFTCRYLGGSEKILDGRLNNGLVVQIHVMGKLKQDCMRWLKEGKGMLVRGELLPDMTVRAQRIQFR